MELRPKITKKIKLIKKNAIKTFLSIFSMGNVVVTAVS